MYYDVVEAQVIGELTLKVRFADGFVAWGDDEVDLAPDRMYQEIAQAGEWAVQ